MFSSKSYEYLVALFFVLSPFLWVFGFFCGNLLAVRSAYRSSNNQHDKVFRGLAEPWGPKIGAMKFFSSWLLTFVIPSMLFFPFYMIFSRSHLLGFIAYCFFFFICLCSAAAWAALFSFQKTILSAEQILFSFRSPRRIQKENTLPDIKITIVEEVNGELDNPTPK